MTWERALTVLLTVATAYLSGEKAFGPAKVPVYQAQGTVEMLAHSASRYRCKYNLAQQAAVARGWEKPTTRAEWDAVCAGDVEEAHEPEAEAFAVCVDLREP